MYEFATYTLFEEYLTVLNCAVDARRTVSGFDGFTAATLRMLEGRRFGVAIYEQHPSDPLDYFTVVVSEGTFRIASHGLAGASETLRLSLGYLEDVVEHPERYSNGRLYRAWDQAASTASIH